MDIYFYHFVILVSFCVILSYMSRLDKRTRQRLKALKRAKNFAPNTPKSTSIVKVKKTRHFESLYKANTSKSGQPVSLAIKDASKPLQPRKSTPEELAVLNKLTTPTTDKVNIRKGQKPKTPEIGVTYSLLELNQNIRTTYIKN